MSDLQHPPSLESRPRPMALRLLGLFLLFWSIGLVSCQAMFVL